MTDTNNTSKAPQLVSIELRVLGAIMEKQLTTPDQYPLTLNSVITACNQKSSREPVSNYSQGDVARALQELQNRGYINKEYGSRADKYSHLFIKSLELGRKHQALLCVMMLRGPQTVSELSTRTQRMVEFTDRNELEHTLDRLCNREIPYCIRLSQQPGQRGERFTHLFSGAPDNAMATGESALSGANTAQAQDSRSPAATPVYPAIHDTPGPDSTDVDILKSELQQTREELDSLKQQLARLYQLTGHEL